MDFLGSLVSGGASLAGSLIDAESARQINEQQIDYAREAREDEQTFNHDEAKIARDYNTEMSNTAYQRQKADLLAAGYNPLLAVNSGGASTPNSAAASAGGSSVPSLNVPKSGIGAAVNSAMDSFVRLKNLDMMKEKVDSEVKNIDADTLSKTLDALSKEPEIVKEKRRYGESGIMGQVYHFVRSLADGLGFTDPFVSSSPHSNSAVRGKQISEEFKDEVAPIIINKAVAPPKRRRHN